MLTLSIIKADTGGFVGHSAVHPEMTEVARRALAQAVGDRLLLDAQVASCGDDISLIMTHEHGRDRRGRTHLPRPAGASGTSAG